MRPCSYMRSSLCPGGDPLFFVLSHHFTEMKKKNRYKDELANCTLHTHDGTPAIDVHYKPTPLLRNTGEGCGQAREGWKRGGENNTNAAPFAPLSFFPLSTLLLFRPNYFLVSRQLTTLSERGDNRNGRMRVRENE